MTDAETPGPAPAETDLSKDQEIVNLKLRIADDARRMFWLQSKVARLEAELALSEASRIEAERVRMVRQGKLRAFRRTFDRAARDLQDEINDANGFT